jgi:hypothetical protein
MNIANPYSAGAIAPLPASGMSGTIVALLLPSPYLTISDNAHPLAAISPYHAVLADERQAAIDHAIVIMDEPVEILGELRAFSRDEMHERP